MQLDGDSSPILAVDIRVSKGESSQDDLSDWWVVHLKLLADLDFGCIS